MPAQLSLPIANRRAPDPSPPPQPQPDAAQQPQRHGVRARVREFFNPLLPIKSRTTRGVNLAPPSAEPEMKPQQMSSPMASGGRTRRASASGVASSDVTLLMPPALSPSPSSGNSPSSSNVSVAMGPRTTRVVFTASPASVKEYTPYDSQLSPWASPSAISPNGTRFVMAGSPPSSSGSSPTAVMAPLALFAPSKPEARGPVAQQAAAPGNQVVTVTYAQQAPAVRVGKPSLPVPAAASAAVQAAPQTRTFAVPSAPMTTVAMGPPTTQTVLQHYQVGQVRRSA
mmetsp:Transcript_115343/g.337211  ORF Transcript_115343/g.337211 Transcript_115343/m.337211 type:complete len:284 (+) Transcript_115343:73-924(+)